MGPDDDVDDDDDVDVVVVVRMDDDVLEGMVNSKTSMIDAANTMARLMSTVT